MAKPINTEVWEEDRCLQNVNSIIYKNLYKKDKCRKKLVEQVSITGMIKSTSYFSFVVIQYVMFIINGA